MITLIHKEIDGFLTADSFDIDELFEDNPDEDKAMIKRTLSNVPSWHRGDSTVSHDSDLQRTMSMDTDVIGKRDKMRRKKSSVRFDSRPGAAPLEVELFAPFHQHPNIMCWGCEPKAFFGDRRVHVILCACSQSSQRVCILSGYSTHALHSVSSHCWTSELMKGSSDHFPGLCIPLI